MDNVQAGQLINAIQQGVKLLAEIRDPLQKLAAQQSPSVSKQAQQKGKLY